MRGQAARCPKSSHPSTCASCLSRKDNGVREPCRRRREFEAFYRSPSSGSDNQSRILLPIGRTQHGGRGEHRRRGDRRDRRVSELS